LKRIGRVEMQPSVEMEEGGTLGIKKGKNTDSHTGEPVWR